MNDHPRDITAIAAYAPAGLLVLYALIRIVL